MSFLKAEWRKLAIANYEIEPSILESYLPPKTELDSWQGTYYVSLVGFMFLNTKILGMSIPFHRNFEEVNLRFYVKYNDGNSWKRGVVFIKEIVPKSALTFVANSVYREHYQTMNMSHSWGESANYLSVGYQWTTGGIINSFNVKADLLRKKIKESSEAEFITEHYWGYTKANQKESFEYEVTHPKWDVYNVIDHSIDVDFGKVYGSSFEFLNGLQPKSVMLAEGSEITVESKKRI